MLNWFANYFNYCGYYDYNYYNYNTCNQSYTPKVRRLRNRNSKNNCNNEKQREQQSSHHKAIEKANLKKGLETKIEQGNKGYDLLQKMGYRDGHGLGKNGKGIMEPLSIVTKNDRIGLGAPHPIQLTRKQKKNQRREQKEAKEHAEKANKAAEQALEAANKAKHVGDYIKAGNKDMDVNKTTKPRRKHSPIRAPTPNPPANKTQSKITAKQNSVTSTAAKNPKERFSINDPCTPHFLRELARCFHSEIELMQLRLQAAASRNPLHADNELIVAKIVIGNNQIVADHTFEFIRTDLVGWIGAYQEDGLDTPLFHSMANNETHITLVCDNAYAYNCLEQCINDISSIKTMGSLKVVRLPPITPLIYCFDAVYEGIARDSALFLTQIHRHKSKLYSDNWVVVSHEVCPEERKTYFIFLIDERSALALNFHYSSNLFICMQKAIFRNRGIVTEEYI